VSPFVTENPAGAMELTVSYPAQQAYVEAFVRQNGVQIAAGDIVQSAVVNADGTFSPGPTGTTWVAPVLCR
jgi:hypothetical protein